MRFATWNVLNGTRLTDGKVDLAGLCEGAVSLRADVLGVQEVDRGQPRSYGADLVAEVAAATGAVDWRFAPALVGTPGGSWREATDDDGPAAGPSYGVGLLSAWPVQSWHLLRMRPAPVRSPIWLAHNRQVIWLHDEPRVALAAVVTGPLGPMTVACTHLSFVPGWNVRQLRRLARWVRMLPGPSILLGDLNMPAGPAAAVSGWRPLGRAATYPSTGPRVQLDHVLGRGELPGVVGAHVPVMPVSDHRPLVVEL